MNEEDVIEISIMHLCIPDYEQKEKDGLIVPSLCSRSAVSVLLNEISDSRCTYHFPVHAINGEPPNVVIIRNLPSPFNLESAVGTELKSMIEKLDPIASIEANFSPVIRYGVVRVTLSDNENAVKVATELDGQLFYDVHLRVSHNDR